MCGIVGCVGRIYRAEEEAFKTLLQLDTTRGPHSTGVVSVGTTRENSTWMKKTGTPWELFDCKGWGAFNARTHRALIGHNRYATAGKITNDNAHPFEHGDFTGVHNGTISARWRLKDHGKFEVDSENIYFNMAEEGIEATLKKLEGPFALVWYNAATGQIQMVRNSQRPLFVCKSEDGKTYFWASEPWMLQVALKKHNIKHTEAVEIKEGELITFDVPFGDITALETDKFLPHIKSVEFYKAPEYKWNGYHQGSNFHHGPNQPAQKGGAKNNIVPFTGGRNQVGQRYLTQYLGKEVVFSVIGERSHNKQDYILCSVEDYLEPDIRIFTKSSQKLGKLLLNSDKMFKGKVKSCTSKDQFGNYLALDHRTIREMDDGEVKQQLELIEQRDETNSPIDMYPVGRGKMVTLEEWYRRTEGGCTWCSDFPKPEEADALIWFRENEYVCPSCSKEDEVMFYINQM